MTFPWIIRAESHGPLKNGGGFVEPLEPGQAGGVGVQGIELGIEQPARLVEVGDRRRAVPLPVFQHRQHGVGGGIAGTQLQQTVEQRYGLRAVRFVPDLSGTRQRGHVVGCDLQRLLEGGQGLFAVALAGEGNALQGPQLSVPGEAFSAERVSSTALSNSPALSAEPIGAVGSSWDWARATEWQASKAARRPSFLNRAIGIPRRLRRSPGPRYFRGDDGSKGSGLPAV